MWWVAIKIPSCAFFIRIKLFNKAESIEFNVRKLQHFRLHKFQNCIPNKSIDVEGLNTDQLPLFIQLHRDIGSDFDTATFWLI